MAKKAFVSLTGGLNNVDRPDTLEEDQLQECVNYEITGVGRLEKRTDPSEYSADLTARLNEIFTKVLFVSEPYYPPNKIKGDYEDFMLFVYGVKKTTDAFSLEIAIPGTVKETVWTGEYGYVRSRGRRRRIKKYETISTYKWTFENENGDSYMQDLYDADLVYTDDSNIDISIGDRNAYISDGVNPIHKVTVTPRGELVASYSGLKAPKNKPRISLEELNQQYDSKDSSITYTSDVDGTTLGSIGLIQAQYTVVMSTGEESNPSPMSDWANGQFFKIAEDGISDERLIKSITVYDLNIPNIPRNLQKDLKYFKIYYRIVRYSEGIELDSMEFSSQEEIKHKTTEATNTGNDYTISAVKTVGDAISYENDAGLPCKVSAVNSGIVMIGGVTKNAAIPANFQYMTPITIRNPNNKNYVDAVVQLELSTGDIKDDDGNIIFDNWSYYFHPDSEYMSGERGIKWSSPGTHESMDQDYYSRHLRMYDTDMTSPIMVYVPFTYDTVKTEDDVFISNLTIYVKIPLLVAAADHTIYFCWNKIATNETSFGDENPSLTSGHTGVEDIYNDISQSIVGYNNDGGIETTYQPWIYDPQRELSDPVSIEKSFSWENNIGIHYGRWCLSSDLINVAQSRQQVFQPRKVPSGSTEILAAPNIDDSGLGDSENSLYDLLNRANLNNNGEATSIDDPLIVQNTIDPPISSPIQSVPDEEYEFGGTWTPASDFTTHKHSTYTATANEGEEDEQSWTVYGRHTSAKHFGAPLHNSWNPDDGYFIDTDANGEEIPGDHTHEAASAPGEWTGADVFTIQTYKYDVGKTDNILDDNGNVQGNVIGTTRGLAPISTLDSTGENLVDYSLDANEQAWTSFPKNNDGKLALNKMYRIPGVINQPLPVLQHTADTLLTEYDTAGDSGGGFNTRQSYHSIGAFKPWCGGWSFRKQALSMGNMPDKGYFYTTLTFRKADIAENDVPSSESGIAPGGTRWDSYKNTDGGNAINHLNTIFYISCGAINDVDATPNYPVQFTQSHYDSVSELGIDDVENHDTYSINENIRQDGLFSEGSREGRQTSANGNFEPRTPGYNRDNFKAISATGLSPGDLEDVGLTEQEGGSGLPRMSAGATGDISYSASNIDETVVDEQDPELDMCPKRNMIVVRLKKQSAFHSEGRITLNVNIGGQNPTFNFSQILSSLDDISSQDYVSVFVYFSWDMIDEKIALGWSLIDDENDDVIGNFDRSSNNHYGAMELATWDLTSTANNVDDFKKRFQNKALYDIGLGNSTYINRVISGTYAAQEELYQQITQSGYHGFYGATELTVGDYITNKNQILAMRNGVPRYELPVGVDWDAGTKNNNISFAATKGQVNKVYDNMIMWSELGRDGFPDLNYKLLKEPVIKIFSAPSFLKFEYSNTFLIFTRNTINRFVLKGTATGWAGSSESLIEEQLQYGLFAPKSLVNIGAEMVWFSEEGVIRWSSEGMQNISSNVINIPLNGDYLGFYCPVRNQYILHDNVTYLSYAYDMTYRMWTTFKGMNITSASTITRGSESENLNLLLNSSTGVLNKYPSDSYTTEDARIKTMDLFMDSGQIKRVNVAYNGNSDANLTYNLAYNDKDSNNIERNSTITAIEKNTWRGLGDLGRLYGRVASFEIENADEIFTIIYDAFTRGE